MYYILFYYLFVQALLISNYNEHIEEIENFTLNFGLALAIILVGAYKNVLFIGTVIFNMIISMVQEIRAKKIVDKSGLGQVSYEETGKFEGGFVVSTEEFELDCSSHTLIYNNRERLESVVTSVLFA